MTKTKSHAERELEILLKTTPDAIIRHFVPEIIALCEAFGNSGQSGGSAPFTAKALSQAIEKLCLQKTIAPLTGKDDEWNDVSDDVFQNNRDSAVFKEKKTGKAYFLDAIIWKSQKRSCWNGSAKLIKNTTPDEDETIRSRQYIKSFPFKPKTFYVDIIDKDLGNDDYEFIISSEKQLEDVWGYYDKSNEQPKLGINRYV